MRQVDSSRSAMRRLTCVVFLFTILSAVSNFSAQQTNASATNAVTTGNASSAVTNAGGAAVSGTTTPLSLTSGYIPVYNGTDFSDSLMFQGSAVTVTDKGNFNLSNSAFSYQIGGSSVLRIAGNHNLFLGVKAGYKNTSGPGNVFSGYSAGYSNTTGESNTFSGTNAGYNTTTGSYNTFSGGGAGYSNTTGSFSTISGYFAGAFSNGSYNTFYGSYTGVYNPGILNIFVGDFIGMNNTGSSNIYIGGDGPQDESNTIRIGYQGTGAGYQNAAYIAGIYGSALSSGIPVYVNSNGQLGTVLSSRRFKEQVRDMGDSSSALMKLRPVTFLYKPEYDKGPRTLQYGLIAEEVAEVYPDLVAYEPDGKPLTVKYQYLNTMLLNELQKQHAVVAAQREEIDSLRNELQLQRAEFQQRLTSLEGLIGRASNAPPAESQQVQAQLSAGLR